MKFKIIRPLLRKAAVLGAVIFAVGTGLSACSIWFEGGDMRGRSSELAQEISALMEDSDFSDDSFVKSTGLDKSGAEVFGDALREIVNDYARESDAEFVRAKVVRAVDGDTIVVEIDGQETKVRLIGVNTPEFVASEEYLEKTGKENTEEGKNASDFTKELLASYPYVYLEKDEEEFDKYGRSLYYVWLEKPTCLSSDIRVSDIENKMLNGILLKEGYAEVSIFRPNVKYAEEFASIVSGQTDDYAVDR